MKAARSDLKTALMTRVGKAASRFHSTFHINSGLGGEVCGAAAPSAIVQGRKSGEVCGAAAPSAIVQGRKNILRIKICHFRRSTNVKLSDQTKENAIEYGDFF